MHDGKRHYRTLGEMPTMSEIAAREAARDLLVQIKIDGVATPTMRRDKIFAHVAEVVFRRHGWLAGCALLFLAGERTRLWWPRALV